MSRHDAIQLDESLGADDVSRAWLVWSGAAAAAIADAFRFCGGPIPTGGLVLGRESAWFRIVWLGGHKVKNARGNAADALDAADVFLYRDSSVALFLCFICGVGTNQLWMFFVPWFSMESLLLGRLSLLLSGGGFLLSDLCTLLL